MDSAFVGQRHDDSSEMLARIFRSSDQARVRLEIGESQDTPATCTR